MNEQWIKMSDRKPTEADFPVWVYDNDGTVSLSCKFVLDEPFWMPANIPAPPKKKTQRELDEDAFINFHSNCDMTIWAGSAWHAALAWERKEVGAMLKPILFVCRSKPENDAIDAIRKRCGLQ